MKTIVMLKGLPASGKSTWARQNMAGQPGAYKRISKDDLRAMLDDGKWSGDNEKFILATRDYLIGAALKAGKHVIVDDTGLHPKHEERLRQLAKEHGAAFEIQDFSGVPVDECVVRDRKRVGYVGEKVIRSMHRQFLAPKVDPVAHDDSLPSCVIVDVDGTLALMNGRGPYEWDKVGNDLPNDPVISLVHMIETAKVIFVSARDECCRAATEAWLHDHDLVTGEIVLHMRPAGDMRDDRIVKREIYEREIKGRYNVLFVVDDRDKVVRQWREMGLPCFQIAEGDF